jgi:hypothetical protein
MVSDQISQITGESDYQQFIRKWDKVVRSGMGNNICETTLMNEFAVQMLPQHDPSMDAVKKLSKAVFELKNVGLKSAVNFDPLEKGDKSSFRNRIYGRH